MIELLIFFMIIVALALIVLVGVLVRLVKGNKVHPDPDGFEALQKRVKQKQFTQMEKELDRAELLDKLGASVQQEGPIGPPDTNDKPIGFGKH